MATNPPNMLSPSTCSLDLPLTMPALSSTPNNQHLMAWLGNALNIPGKTLKWSFLTTPTIHSGKVVNPRDSPCQSWIIITEYINFLVNLITTRCYSRRGTFTMLLLVLGWNTPTTCNKTKKKQVPFSKIQLPVKWMKVVLKNLETHCEPIWKNTKFKIKGIETISSNSVPISMKL